MTAIDLSEFVETNETAETRAYEHALDISYRIVEEMERQGLNQRQLAGKMGISPARLSTMLNTQPNMTLKSLAQFELALGIRFELLVREQSEPAHTVEGVLPLSNEKSGPRPDDPGCNVGEYLSCDSPAPDNTLTFPLAA